MDTVYEQLKHCKSFAIMGGTFDPIHYGHLATAAAVKYKFGLDKILFIPAGRPAHKDNSKVTDNEDRYKMTCLAVESNPDFLVTRMEIDRPGKSYSVDTVRELKKICGHDVRFYFITGADAILDIFTWKNPAELLSLCEFIAVTRPGYTKKKMVDGIVNIIEQYGSKIYYMEVPALDISSSDIRKRLRSGMPVKYLLPESVEKYIYENHLYEQETDREESSVLSYNVIQQRLQSVLSIERYIHTLGVVKTAKKLAVRYGCDVEKASLAALLHDCTKDYPEDMKRRFCKEYHVTIDKYMDKKIDLVHPFLGAEVARREFGVEDEEILNAIKYHTTGRPNMTMLEKIVFVADFIEPNRKKIDNLEEIRKVAYEDIDKAVKMILENTIEFVRKSGKVLHPLSLEALEYYSKY